MRSEEKRENEVMSREQQRSDQIRSEENKGMIREGKR